MKFTAAQLEAIKHVRGNLQLIACAGSGKTEVVARCVANLLKSGVVPADELEDLQSAERDTIHS